MDTGNNVPAPAEHKELPKAPPVSQEEAHGTNGDWRGAFDAIGEAFDRIKANPEPAILVTLAYGILSVLSQVTNSAEHLPYGAAYDYTSVLWLVFLLAVPTYALAIADNKKITLAEFMRFRAGKFFALFLISILAGLAIAGSLILLIFPVIWVAAWVYLVTYIAVDKDVSIMEAFGESKRLGRDNKGKVWGLIGASILLGIVVGLIGWIPLVGETLSAAVGGLMTVIIAGASALLYRWLQKNVHDE